MKDGDSAEEPAEVSRQELYGEYVNYHLQPGAEVRPCCDPSLLKKTARYLLSEPEPAEAFTVFPFYRAVSRDRAAPAACGRKHLNAFMKATELLETICVNLFLQPWKKEIKTLKTFTGPFIYGLLPVLSSSTIQSVLGSIGYLPHTDTPQSEYRLREDVNPDRAMLLGFELLLARVKCDHLLEILQKDQLEPQEFLEVLHRRMELTALAEAPEKKTTMGQKEEENTKMDEARRKEVPLVLDPVLAVKPQPKPRRCRLIGVDQSIMEMQMTYPDLAFRGRPLLPDKPQRANGGSKDAHTPNTSDNSGDGKAAEVPKVAATTTRSRSDGSKADEVFGGDRSGCHDGDSGGPAAGDANSSHISTTDGSTGGGELGGPQALSLHITLRAASKAQPSLKPGEAPPTAEPPARTQQQTGADLQNNRPANPKRPSLSSTDEAQELRELAESMGQLHVHDDATEEGESKEGNANKGRSQTEREAEEEDPGRPAMTGPALSRAAGRGRSSPCDAAGTGRSSPCDAAGRGRSSPCDAAGRGRSSPCDAAGRGRSSPSDAAGRGRSSPSDAAGRGRSSPSDAAGRGRSSPSDAAGRGRSSPSDAAGRGRSSPSDAAGRGRSSPCDAACRGRSSPCDAAGRGRSSPSDAAGRGRSSPSDAAGRGRSSPSDAAGRGRSSPSDAAGRGRSSPCDAAGRGRSSPSDAAAMEEQQQQQQQRAPCRHSTLACEGGDATEQQEVEDTARAEPGRDEEQLAKSFVMVERHNK